jgi:type IV pilus assembly protein PilX
LRKIIEGEGVFNMMVKKKMILRDQSGVALVIALIMIIVLTLIGLASTFTSTFEIKLSGNKRGSTDAFYAADSGLQVTIGRIENFNLSQFNPITNRYNPFTDQSNINPTNAVVTIVHDTTQNGPPRSLGSSAMKFDYEHFMIQSTGQDQTELSLIRSTTALEEKVVRLIPSFD